VPEFTGRLRNLRLATAPSSPVAGEQYYDTALGKLRFWNGSAWVDAATTDIVYNGDYPANTPYTDGDIVIYNSTAYLCVEATSEAPTAWPQAGGALPPGGTTGQILTKTSATDYASSWQAAPATGADLVYNGDFPTNTPYTDGDIVISGGIAYMCVVPTSSAPTPWSGGSNPAPTPPLLGYSTTLPASPVNGQETVLVDSTTNPTWQWRFRYNTGSTSPYKWEFVGGTPPWNRVVSQEGTNSASYVDLATVGPQLTLPCNGDYMISWGCAGQAQTGYAARMGIKFGAAATTNADSIYVYQTTPGGVVESYASVTRRYSALTAGTVLKAQYHNNGGGTLLAYFTDRWLSVTPVRVS